MKKPKTRKPIPDQKGTKYWFDEDRFNSAIKAYEPSQTKSFLITEIAEKTGYSKNTVRDWVRIRYTPSDIEAVYVIEDLLNLNRGDLLLNQNPEDQRMNKSDNTVITAEERVAAARLYSIMYDMILAFENNYPDQPQYAEFFAYNMQWTEYGKYKFAHQEEFRYKCLVDIRKNAIWFPKSMRDSLEELVNKEFGPADYDYCEMAYGSEEYQEYLKRNNLRDNYESRDLYATAFRRELFEDLDRIFEKYLIQ